jgi:hypothetical protein
MLSTSICCDGTTSIKTYGYSKRWRMQVARSWGRRQADGEMEGRGSAAAKCGASGNIDFTFSALPKHIDKRVESHHPIPRSPRYQGERLLAYSLALPSCLLFISASSTSCCLPPKRLTTSRDSLASMFDVPNDAMTANNPNASVPSQTAMDFYQPSAVQLREHATGTYRF